MKTIIICLDEEDTRTEDEEVLYEGSKPDWLASYRDQEGYNVWCHLIFIVVMVMVCGWLAIMVI